MTRSYPKSSQIANDSALETLGVSTETPLNTLFDKLAQEADSPYRLHAAAIPDSKLYITASSNALATGVQEVASLTTDAVSTFASGYIDFQARAYSANIAITFPSSTVGFYRLCVITAMRDGSIKATFTAESASIGGLVDPLTTTDITGVTIGWVQLVCTNASGTFKTAGSSTSVIENIVGVNPRIFQFTDRAKRTMVAALDPSVTATDGFTGQLLQQTDTPQLWLKAAASSTTNWRPLDWSQIIANYSGWATTTGVTITLTGTNKETLQITGTRTFYVKGRPFKKTATETITMSGTKGVRFFTYDVTGTLQVSTSPFDWVNQAGVAVAYWNGTSGHSLGWELHGLTDAADHYWKHMTVGTRYVSGLQQTSSPLAAGNPTGDTESYIWLTGGRLLDEDIKIDIVSATSPSNRWDQNLGSGLTNALAGVFPFLYIDAANTAVFVPPNADRFPFIYSGANGMPQYNNAGTMTTTPSGNFAVYWICGTSTQITPDTNFTTIGTAVFIRPHVATFTSLATARAATFGDLNWTDMSVQENKVLYQIIYQCNTNYNNATHRCKIVEVNDIRAASPVPVGVAASASSHLLLSNLNGGQYGDGNHNNLVVSKIATSSLPTVNDDVALYKTSTLWVDSTAKRGYICVNNTGAAADWREFIYSGGNESAISLGTNTSASLTLKTNNVEAGVIDNAQTWSIGPVAGGVIHTVRGALTVNGNLTVTGSTTTVNSTVVEVADNEIKLNKGEAGAGVTAGQAGILIDRGSATNYEFIFRESDDLFRIGLVGATQAVATREDAPLTNGVSFWNSTAYRFDTDVGFAYDPSTNMLSAANITTDEITFGTTTFKLGTFSGTNFRISSTAGLLLDLSTTVFTVGRSTTVHTLIGTNVNLFDSNSEPKLTFDVSTGIDYYFKRVNTPTVAFQFCSAEPAVKEHFRINASDNIELGQDANLIHKIRGTGALAIPSGTTTNRDALTPAAGIIRWSTTGSVIEYYTGSAWSNVATQAYASSESVKYGIVFG